MLLEEEFVAIDLTSEGWPQYKLPYLYSVHSSAIICTHYVNGVSRKFYDSLVAEARQIFEATRIDVEGWLRGALNPLDVALKEHEVQLGKRIENVKKMRDNLQSVDDRAKFLERQMLQLKAQHDVLLRIKVNMENPVAQAAPGTTQHTAAAPRATLEHPAAARAA